MADISIQELQFTKDWRSPTDFPTFQPDERQVREDQQILHDETRDYINTVIGGAFKTVESNRKELEKTVTEMQADGAIGYVKLACTASSVDAKDTQKLPSSAAVASYVSETISAAIGNAIAASY